MFKQLGRFVSWLIAVTAVVGVIYPAFVDERMGLTQIAISMFKPELSFGFAMRWVSLIFLVGAAYIISVGIIYRRTPITVARTEVTITFHDSSGQKVKMEREQLLRANRTDVTAYFFKVSPENDGATIPKDSIHTTIHGDCDGFESSAELHGSETRGFEVTHNFGRSLPYAWYMPLIPAASLNKSYNQLSRRIKLNTAVRRQSLIYLNEFNHARPTMNFSASTYPQQHVTFKIHFHGAIPDGFAVRRIQTIGVVNVPVDRQSETLVEFHIDRLHNETVRISWDRPAAVPAVAVV